MSKIPFNINHYVYVQIPYVGLKALEKRHGIKYLELHVFPAKQIIDGKEYYKLQMHCLIEMLGGDLDAHAPEDVNAGVISTNILFEKHS